MAIQSYERGWFSSTAETSFEVRGGRRFTVHQKISHGPFPFQSGRLSPVPVLAVADSTVDLPTELQFVLQRVFGNRNLLKIQTVLTLSGAIDTHLSVTAFTATDSLPGISVGWDELDGELYMAGPYASGRWTLPAFRLAAKGNSLAIEDLSTEGESHKDASGIWLSTGHFRVKSVEFAGGAEAASKVALQDISISRNSSLKNAALELDSKLTVASVEIRGLEMGPVELSAVLANIDANAGQQWLANNRTLGNSALSPPEQAQLVRQKLSELTIALAKRSPSLSLDFQATMPRGKAYGNAKLGLSSGFADDPAIRSGSADTGLLTQRLRDHSYLSAELHLPAPLPPELMSEATQRRLVAEGFAVREGSEYVTRPNYSMGRLLVNGRQLFPK